MKQLKYFLLSLLSRKFLLALSGTLAFVANKQYVEAVVLMLGYFGFNVAETFAPITKQTYLQSSPQQNAMSQNVVTDEVITGKVE